MKEDTRITAKGFYDGLRPVERISVSQWSDKYRYLSNVAASEPGRYRTSRTPFLKPIMDALSAFASYQFIVLMKAAQVGSTELGFNWLGYIIDISPAPTLLVQPTDDMVKRVSKMRFDPMVKATPRLRDKIKSSRTKDSGNTIKQKDFPGGTIMMTGANSPVGLRSMPAKNIMLDEVDAYPQDLDGEGSPIDLAKARTRTFAKRKIFVGSTPTVENKSVIAKEFEDTDQNYWEIPCIECGGFQPLEWDRLRWTPGKPDSVKYCCIHCEFLMEDRHKDLFMSKGKMVSHRPANISPQKIGFHINALYSPRGWYSWAEAVRDFEAAEKDIFKKKTFVNTVLGLTWKDDGEQPPWEDIYNRREVYTVGSVHKSVAFITAGVDVQKDRIEVEIVGWVYGRSSYSIDYRVLPGRTEQAEVWKDLAKLLNETFLREDGALLPIRMMAVDSGYNTSYVYEFCRQHSEGKVIPVKGHDSQATILSAPKKVEVTRSGKKVGKVKVWHVGVSMLKSELYGWLRLNPDEDGGYPDGYCHFPQYAQEYFRGITAEQLEFKIVKGFRKYEWVKKYERNEPLDLRIYARAAAAMVGMDRWSEEDWKHVHGGYFQKTEVKTTNKPNPFTKKSFWGK